jgi:hypothetical protein
MRFRPLISTSRASTTTPTSGESSKIGQARLSECVATLDLEPVQKLLSPAEEIIDLKQARQKTDGRYDQGAIMAPFGPVHALDAP